MLNRKSVRGVVTAAAVMFSVAYSNSALAQPFAPGDVITYPQGGWGDATTIPGQLLLANYNAVYLPTFGVVEVGIPGTAGFSMNFTNRDALIDYLPASSALGPLSSDVFNPTTTVSGALGGEVLALRLNIDFSDAGVMFGNLGIQFGDLVIASYDTLPQLNGLTVRQFSAEVNRLLGGGSAIYGIDDLGPVANQLNSSFINGTPSQWAQDHLRIVPEPTTAGLAFMGLVALACRRKRGAAGSARSSIL